MLQPLDVLLTFAAGLLAFLSPCMLPLVPGYLAYLTGGDPSDRRRTMVRAAAFVGGFSAIFILLGAAAAPLGQALVRNIGAAQLVGGGIVVALGLFIVFEHRLPVRMLASGGPSRPATIRGGAGAATFGMAFAMAWSPCIGPMLGAALTLAGTQDTAWQGAALLAVFSAGLGLPMVAAAAGASWLHDRSGWIRRHMGPIRIASGILVITFGILIASGLMTTIAAELQRISPAIFYEL